jgi:hypothetical protein
VLDSEISGLADLHAYLKYGNYVAQFSFPLLEIPPSKPKFIERLEDDYIVREPRKDQPQAAMTEKHRGSPARSESRPTSDEHKEQSAVTNPAVEAQEVRQGELSFGPRI